MSAKEPTFNERFMTATLATVLEDRYSAMYFDVRAVPASNGKIGNELSISLRGVSHRLRITVEEMTT